MNTIQLTDEIKQSIDNKVTFLMRDYISTPYKLSYEEAFLESKDIMMRQYKLNYYPTDNFFVGRLVLIDDKIILKSFRNNNYGDMDELLEIKDFENILSLKFGCVYWIIESRNMGSFDIPIIYLSDLKRNVLQELKSLPNIGIDYFEALERFKSNI
jgi:hypothetical protein